MDPFRPKALLCGLSAATALATRAVRKRALTKTGASAGFVVGFLLVSTGLRGMNLFIFYHLGSTATKYKKAEKTKLDATVSTHSVRGYTQVLAVSIIATVLSLYHAVMYGPEVPIDFGRHPLESQLACAILAHHATSLADTLASELGTLSKSTPILITQPWRRVPPGTNGGITLAGTLWSLAGGVAISISTMALDLLSGTPVVHVRPTLLFGAVCGLVGSMLDSLIGATLQATNWDDSTKQVGTTAKTSKRICGVDLLTNEQVNFVSVAITAALGGWILGPWIFG